MALRASSCVIGELWLRDAAPIDGSISLRRSQPDLLHTTPEVWPARVKLDGLTYGTLTPRLPAAQRLEVPPNFNTLVYTLDLLMPIIDFGQEKAFSPEGAYQWLAYLHIAAGWILATTVVAGITRAVNRQ